MCNHTCILYDNAEHNTSYYHKSIDSSLLAKQLNRLDKGSKPHNVCVCVCSWVELRSLTTVFENSTSAAFCFFFLHYNGNDALDIFLNQCDIYTVVKVVHEKQVIIVTSQMQAHAYYY